MEYYKDSDLSRDLLAVFRTMEAALQTLFQSISGGIDWGGAMPPCRG